MKTFSQRWWDNQNPQTHKLLEKFVDFPKTLEPKQRKTIKAKKHEYIN